MERGAHLLPGVRAIQCNPTEVPTGNEAARGQRGRASCSSAPSCVIAIGASNGGSAAPGTYKIELDNAFGLVSGEDFKVAGVVAGSITVDRPRPRRRCTRWSRCRSPRAASGQFRSDAFCESRPQSLIGEYFINCDPGTSSKVLPPGSTIPVTQTSSTIPADLLQDIMRLPYRERLTLLINELGAGVAGRSGDLQAALDRAVPALTETDNLLHLLAQRLAARSRI